MIALLLSLALAEPDRSAPPPVTAADPMELPKPLVEALTPATTVHWLPVEGLRRVAVVVRLRRGAMHLDGWPSPASELTGDLWMVAAKKWSPDDLGETLDLYGIEVSASVGLRDTVIELDVPRDHLEVGLDLLTTLIRKPTFPGKELKRSVLDYRQYIENDAPNSLSAVASFAEYHAWFPPEHPRSGRVDLDAWDDVKRSQLLDRHARLLTESPIDLLVLGDIDPEGLRPTIRTMVDGLGTPGSRDAPPPPRADGLPAYLGVDLAGSEQAVIALRLPAPPRGHLDETAFAAAQHAIGGHFLARLNKNLREDKGWTYGGYSGYRAWEDTGFWTYDVQVGRENVGAALTEIFGELSHLREGGVTPDEHAAYASGIISQWNTTLRDAGSAAARYDAWIREVESLDDAAQRLAAGRDLDPAITAVVAERWLGSDDRVVLVVGDRATLEPQLESFGVFRWLTPDQAIRGDFDVPRGGP